MTSRVKVCVPHFCFQRREFGLRSHFEHGVSLSTSFIAHIIAKSTHAQLTFLFFQTLVSICMMGTASLTNESVTVKATLQQCVRCRMNVQASFCNFTLDWTMKNKHSYFISNLINHQFDKTLLISTRNLTQNHMSARECAIL